MKFFDLFRSPQPGATAKRAPLASLLEPRMLFDGAVAATVADAASNTDHASADSSAKNTSSDDSSQHATDAATPPAATSDNRHEVVFVDGQIGDKQQIIDGLKPGTEVVVLGSNKDGLQQIADYLKDRSDIDAIHIISHGDTGKMQLGNSWVDNASLASHGEALSAIGKALNSDGDILLYGCTVGANGEGQDFIQALADKTGADVAASDDATGAASRGGDWVLERQVGTVETTALRFDAYSGLLANGTLTFNANDNANWADGIAEDGNGGSSNIPGITLEISNTSDTTGTNLGLPLVYGDAELNDQFYALTTYDNSVLYTGWKGMQIRSADGSEFKLSSFDYLNWGETTPIQVTVKGYRDGVEVASTTFFTAENAFFYQEHNTVLGAAFGSVDSVILYTAGDSWHGLNTIQIADAVVPNTPAVTTTSGGSTAFTEGNNVASTPVIIDTGITVSDADDSTLATASVSITGGLQNGQDVLAFTDNPATMGNITGSYNAATGVMSLSSAGATATLAQWQAALRSVTYTNTSDTPNTGTRTISFVVNDSHNNSNTATKTVTVAAVNDTPIATSSGGSTAFTEGAGTSTPVVIDSGITLSDADSTTLGTAEVKITGNLHTGEDELAFTNNPATMGNISASYNAATGVMTLTSAGATATLAQWQAALRSVTYTNTSHAPDTGNRTISFTVSDNTSTSATVTKVVTVASTDSSPVTTTSGGNTTFTEGTPAVIDSGITLSDADSASLASATVRITGNLHNAEDVLAFTNFNPTLYGNIVGTYDAGTGVYTLSSAGATATLAQWQAALRAVTYSNSSDAPNTSNRTLSFSVNDGNSESNAATKTVTISAVNDAPVNHLPGSQSVQQNGTLTLNTGNGNLISISDVDAGGGVERVTLTASNGQISLSGTSGLSFLVGSGSGDVTMTFEGTLADINNALNGLTFTPTAGYHGSASIQVVSNDLGLTGAGGNQTDTDVLSITVLPDNPVITSVTSSSPDGAYGVGDTVTVTVNFSTSVNVDTTGGEPSLALSTGRSAVYTGGSGSNTLTFSYTVQAGDSSADLDYSSTTALALNGATVQAAGNNAILTLAAPGAADSLGANANLAVDGIAATVTSVTVPADGTYVVGQNLDFTVNFSENVTVDTNGGTPRIAVTLDTGGTVYASYVSGSGGSALVFRLTVSSGQLDSNGITLGALSLNGGSVRDVANNNSVLTLNSVGSTAGVLVDAVAPQVSGITLDNASPTSASSVSYTVTFSEDVSGVDISDFNLTTSGTVNATLQSVVQINAHTYQVLVNSITGLGTLNLALNSSGTGIADGAGNAISAGFSGPGYTISLPVVPTPTPPVVSPDPQFLAYPAPLPSLPTTLTPPLNPFAPVLTTTSPVLPPALFEQPTVGSGIPTLGNIFINQNPMAPSYIAQVFSSSDSGGDGSAAGFLGFGGGDGGVFGSSSLSSMFDKESTSDIAPIELFNKNGKGGDANQGLRGVFGAPTLGAQLHQLQHHEQQQIHELATALGQLGNPVTPS